MFPRPRADDRPPMRTLHRWYAVLWVLGGLCPPIIAVLDRPDGTKYGSSALMAVIALSYAAAAASPGNRVLREYVFPSVLVAGVGGMAALLEGGAALYVVSLPLFWIFAPGPRPAIAYGLAGAAATIAGGVVGSGSVRTGNALATLIGCAAGVLLGLWAYRVVRLSGERARRLGTELDRAQRELAEAHQRQGAADERERLAREIHDTLAQGLASIVVLAEAARSGLETDPGRSARQLLSIERTARENLAEARVLVGAAPQNAAPGSLARTLRRTLDRFAEDTGLAVTADLPDLDCDRHTRIALLRCTQESLANVRKHAAATAVSVVLARHPHGVELEITDDGRGFRVDGPRGFGLDGMRRRLAELGGELTVTSAPGEGTRILAMIPENGQV
ncbi:sensor histidine kinase [Spirillospora sp. CA-294931]|uniref:sensor histidine kinase n=1 Tax=Spirillospora sp. CA-294931 TaxID=3240042 RepID=UPI003D92CCB4